MKDVVFTARSSVVVFDISVMDILSASSASKKLYEDFKMKMVSLPSSNDTNTRITLETLEDRWSDVSNQLSTIIRYSTDFGTLSKEEEQSVTVDPLKRFEDKMNEVVNNFNFQFAQVPETTTSPSQELTTPKATRVNRSTLCSKQPLRNVVI